MTELFNVTAYANNINDNFTKNMLKTLLAKILRDKNETKKALEILDEQVAYFAKEKNANAIIAFNSRTGAAHQAPSRR